MTRDAGGDGDVGAAIDEELGDFRVHAFEMGQGMEDRRLTAYAARVDVGPGTGPPERAAPQNLTVRRLGSFEINALLGRGGMGEVYRAHDTKLGRDVAIKVLPPEFTADPDRLARFEREARVVASLNHPHIAAIHGVEESDGVRGLVLELVEGETLADRLAQSSGLGRPGLRLPEALSYARQIAGVNAEATVRYVRPPAITRITASPNVLWPPNGKVVRVSVEVGISGDSDPAPGCQITGVTSNEAIVGTAWRVTGALTVDLRAERLGLGTGRIYTLTVTCTNSSELSSTATVRVTVPHDQRK